ncbi:flavin monooxygenase-like protein [Coniochaeta sp. 2T2.1]|nr:flavin monooxygenase-like protein [Coniochaeta sp. 2T2.1]
MAPPTVAVVGLGALGLVALKNLLEEGFDAVGFDKNDYVGGLWHFQERSDQLTVMRSTLSNGSKQRGCFTDFPLPADAPDFVPAAALDQYLQDYAKHFGLMEHARLRTSFHGAKFHKDGQKWALSLSTPESPEPHREYFDKVVFAMGTDQTPVTPEIEGIEKFKGFKQHSMGFKDPKVLAGKRVMVVGFGNTAADMATELAPIAEQVYLSHRHGAIILPRWVNGKPVDHVRTYRKYVILNLLSRYAPSLWEKTMNSVITGLVNKTFNLKPEWGFQPAPSITNQRPLVNDDLIPCLEDGSITSTTGIKRVIDDKTVETTDGKQYEVDALLFCTGFTVDYKAVGPDADPTRDTTAAWERNPNYTGRSLPRLYQNIFSLEHPHSLAFIGHLSFMNPAFFMFDLATMAVAQLWKGASAFPPPAEMKKQVDDQHAWILELAKRGPVTPSVVRADDWMVWVESVICTGLPEYLGYTLKGWQLWLTDRKFCNMLMDGLLSPHAYRLFPGKRKAWPGARDAIVAMNEDREARFGPME